MDHVLSKFKFGEKSREWIQMLFKYAQTCIKATGFVSKYYNISRSCSQSCPIALICILHAMTWTIRGGSEIQRVIFRGEKWEYIKTKICIFADDTQLFNKNDESVSKSYDILSIYEKASGSKVNYEKTKYWMVKK